MMSEAIATKLLLIPNHHTHEGMTKYVLSTSKVESYAFIGSNQYGAHLTSVSRRGTSNDDACSDVVREIQNPWMLKPSTLSMRSPTHILSTRSPDLGSLLSVAGSCLTCGGKEPGLVEGGVQNCSCRELCDESCPCVYRYLGDAHVNEFQVCHRYRYVPMCHNVVSWQTNIATRQTSLDTTAK
eukprot:2608013-Amphidinium_carterae.1